MFKPAVLLTACVAVSCLGLERPAQSRDAPRLATITGYVAVRGQTVVLFKDAEAAEKFDYGRCYNVGSFEGLYRHMKVFNGKKVVRSVENLGDPYANFRSMGSRYEKLRGRDIDQYCDDTKIYWAVSVQQ